MGIRQRYIHQKELTVRMGLGLILVSFMAISGCSNPKEHIAPAINERDSVSMMTSYGVNTLISDSGVIKYRIVTERWDVNIVKNPSRWTFEKGIFLEQFDEKFHVEAYIQADTAWYYDTKKLWELRGRVRVRNVNGLRFYSDELFWDGYKHEIYSNKPSKVITPDRTLEGTYFLSDEHMRHYTVSNSKGSFVKSDFGGDKQASQPQQTQTNNASGAPETASDTVQSQKREPVKRHASQKQLNQ